MMTQSGELMDLDELCGYLNMSKSTLYKHLQTGRIPGTKIGKHWRFNRDNISQWLASKTRLDDEVMPSGHSDDEQKKQPSLSQIASLDGNILTLLFTEEQCQTLAKYSLCTPLSILTTLATKKGKSHIMEILKMKNDNELDSIATRLTNFINGQNLVSK